MPTEAPPQEHEEDKAPIGTIERCTQNIRHWLKTFANHPQASRVNITRELENIEVIAKEMKA